MPNPRIRIRIECDVTLGVVDIWPDDDAPETVTEDEVRKQIERTTMGSYASDLMRDWNLDGAAEVSVFVEREPEVRR